MKAYLELFRDNKILFIENGCGGNPVANLILNEPGASKIVYSTLCLYDEQFNRNFFDIPEDRIKRAISRDFVEEVAFFIKSDNFYPEHPFAGIRDNIDYIFTSSYVLNSFTGNINNIEDSLEANKVSTHGYINITNISTGKTITFHVSLHQPNSRYKNIKLIGEIGLKLILDTINDTVSTNCYIDSIYVDHAKDELLTLNYLGKNEQDHVIYFNKDNKDVYRVEDLFRSLSKINDSITIVKGSFNPLHNGHLEALKITQEHTNSDKAVFAISLSNRDKESKDYQIILNIIHNINKNGFDVLLFNKAYYFENNNLLIQKFKTQINYGIGTDIVKRLLDDCDKQPFENLYENSKFYYIQRNNHELNSYFDKLKMYANNSMFNIANNTLPEVNSTQIRSAIQNVLTVISKETIINYINENYL